ncbi:DNA phosphorothioation-dependent restriction protein DptF [Methanobrevibacter smithii]|uniref:DNA phosphorothioation-dependent restriction protein DptF n=1 Tax=Methanobrevibacter smithii TaxID=2173 RepID=UPI0037DC07FF
MCDYCFSFLEEKFPEFAEKCKEVEVNVVNKHPKAAILLGGSLVEEFTGKICDLADVGHLKDYTQFDRLRELGRYNIIPFYDQKSFDRARKIRNKAAHSDGESTMDKAYVMHRMLYNVAVWFYKNYGEDPDFVSKKYEGPIYEKEELSKDTIEDMVNKAISSKIGKHTQMSLSDDNSSIVNFRQGIGGRDNNYLLHDFSEEYKKIKGSYLLGELYKLRNSSKEAVEDADSLNSFKEYLHVERGIQNEFIKKLKEVVNDNSAHLVMLCGNVGDGKSHLLAFLNTHYPDLANQFKIHNDATESFDPNKNSIDTLSEVLSAFKDSNINNSNEKFILAINLGVLNNFIESDYANEEYTIIKQNLVDSNIFDPNNFSQNYDSEHVNIISFADYNMFELNGDDYENRVSSTYISSLIQKVVDDSQNNPFYQAYLKDKELGIETPVIYNYEMLSNKKVQDVILNLIIKISIKYKKIISTRDLLNFIYEILVPANIEKPSESYETFDYLKDFLPNLLYTKVNSSDLLKLFSFEDPINLRKETLDDLIIALNISDDILTPIKEYIDDDALPLLEKCFKEYGALKDGLLNNEHEIISSLIRFASIFGKNNIENVFINDDYLDYLDYLYYYNTKSPEKYQKLFNQVNDAIFNWKKYMGSDIINIDELNNFQVGRRLKLHPKISEEDKGLVGLNYDELGNRFKTDIRISFSVNNSSDLISINIDYPLYSSFVALNKGFKPNKTEREKLIVFKEFINSIINQTESDNRLFVKTIYNDENFVFEYDELFRKFSFKEA